MKDGMYIVQHGPLTAAFVVRQGRVTVCAPSLRKNFDFFAHKARLIPTDLDIGPPQQPELELEESLIPSP